MILEVTNRSGRKNFVIMAMTEMEKKAHQAWRAAINRCRNPGCTAYEDYGGRGIKVCERWENSFQAFIDDVGLPPNADLWIERINNNGNYEPGNVKWATKPEQHANRRNTRWITIGSRTLPMATWAKMAGISTVCMFKRLEYGMSGEDLLKPVNFLVEQFDVGDGRMMTMADISRQTGLSRGAIWQRIDRGIRGQALLAPRDYSRDHSKKPQIPLDPPNATP
jgi:hypothetical protein